MQEQISFSYPYSAETVLAMFRNRDYITKKHAQMRQRNIRILEAVEKPGELYRLSVRRDIKALLPASIPDFASNWVERMSVVTTTIEWQLHDRSLYVGRNTATLDEGLPVKIYIDYWLVPEGDRCTHKQIMHANVDVPLLRGPLERYAMDGVRNIQTKDYEYNLEFLKTFQPEPAVA